MAIKECTANFRMIIKDAPKCAEILFGTRYLIQTLAPNQVLIKIADWGPEDKLFAEIKNLVQLFQGAKSKPKFVSEHDGCSLEIALASDNGQGSFVILNELLSSISASRFHLKIDTYH